MSTLTSASGLPRSASAVATCAAAASLRDQTLRVGLRIGLTLFLTMLPVTMIVPVLRELVSLRMGASSTWAHLFMSVNMIAAVLCAPLGGVLADRLPRRTHLLTLLLIVNALILLAMSAVTSLAGLMLLRFAEGAVHVLAVSTLMALACDWATPQRRGGMMGLVGSALTLGTACGAPLGGRIGQIDATLVLYLGSACALLAAGLAFWLLQDAAERHFGGNLRDTLRLIVRTPRLVGPYALGFVDRFGVGVIVSSFVLFLGEVHRITPAQRGGLLALFLFPFALLCYPVGKLIDRSSRTPLLVLGNVGFGAALACYGVVPAAWLPLLMLASGLFSAMLFTPNLALIASLAPPEQRATVYAGFNLCGSLGFLAGPLLGAAMQMTMAAEFGAAFAYQAAMMVGGGVIVVTTLLLLTLQQLDARRDPLANGVLPRPTRT